MQEKVGTQAWIMWCVQPSMWIQREGGRGSLICVSEENGFSIRIERGPNASLHFYSEDNVV